MRFTIIVILLVLLLLPPVTAQADWCSKVNTLYFQHSASPDIPGYEELRNYPSGAAQTDENVTVLASSGLVKIDTYITPINEPSITAFEPGLRRYRTYHYVDKDIGITTFVFRPFLYHIDGTNTSLYELVTEDINALSTTEYLTSYVISNTVAVLPTDRIGISVYVNTTSSAAIQAHFVYEGATHHSHIESGYYSCETPTPIPTIPNLPAKQAVDQQWETWLILALGLIVVIAIFSR